MSMNRTHAVCKPDPATFRTYTPEAATSQAEVESIAGPHAQDSGTVETAAYQTERRDTPLRPSAPIPVGAYRATLTVVNGLDAGRLEAIGGGLVIGRAPDADLVVEDDAVSRYHARITPCKDGDFVIEDLESANGTFVGANRVKRSLLVTGDQVQLGRDLRLRFRIIDATEESLYRELYDSSVHDALTRVFNRRHFSDRLIVEVSHARRTKGDMAVLMIDVDRLKEVNDSYGHLAGDRALSGIAASIGSSIRLEDVLARYGGDEFAILAPGTSHQDAARLAERVAQAVEGLCLVARGERVPVTVSIGVASLSELEPSDQPHMELLSRADERLYRAKRAGRNSVFSGADDPA
jgi:two-component system cell cycle response regulator